jgi:hypothetical protein
MYATAHRVTRGDGQEGINTFLYLHGPTLPVVDAAAIPEQQPGRLTRHRTPVPPGNNVVSSYLDVIAPDDTSMPELERQLAMLRADLPERRNPTVFRGERVTLRFGVQLVLEPEREAEFERLAQSLLEQLRETE